MDGFYAPYYKPTQPMLHTSVRILIIDDDEDDFLITKDYISDIHKDHYQVSWCPRYEEALWHMQSKSYDLYFLDYRLGAISGVDLLKKIHELGLEVPVILLTGKGNYHVDMEAMHFGAIDYLVKSELSPEKLERSIRYALERAASMLALKANERKYRQIFENTRDVVFIADEHLCFQEVNHAIETMLGYEMHAIQHKKLTDLFTREEQRKSFTYEILQGHNVDDMEVWLSTANGEQRFGIITATIETDVHGNRYIQGIIHDITNLKKIEKTTLYAEKLAAAGRLVKILAHEVRNPLNNITLSVEQLQQDIHEEFLRDYLDIIARNSRRISDIIAELLTTSGPSEISLQKTSAQTVLGDILAAASDRITLKHIRIAMDYPEEPLYIMADKEKLTMALLNIVINATEAVDEYDGEITVSLTETEKSIILQIGDNGPGIPEEYISRLFEPYFTQKKNGMGLGLSVSLNVIQAHNAAVDVSSSPDTGTKFTITFPAIHAS